MNEEYLLKEGVYELTREFFCLECKFQYGDDVCPPNCSAAKFMDAVFDLPGEDVRKNIAAHWSNISVSVTGASTAECSNCGAVVRHNFCSNINYCPNCGAGMRKCGENYE